mmetsp:Transcript_8816/g.23460  ORF Transcript_8816/g.23460 Transcript_8816/m.23460 type:complete len:263 (-) Transcript_8816:558-1346(-)
MVSVSVPTGRLRLSRWTSGRWIAPSRTSKPPALMDILPSRGRKSSILSCGVIAWSSAIGISILGRAVIDSTCSGVSPRLTTNSLCSPPTTLLALPLYASARAASTPTSLFSPIFSRTGIARTCALVSTLAFTCMRWPGHSRFSFLLLTECAAGVWHHASSAILMPTSPSSLGTTPSATPAEAGRSCTSIGHKMSKIASSATLPPEPAKIELTTLSTRPPDPMLKMAWVFSEPGTTCQLPCSSVLMSPDMEMLSVTFSFFSWP